MALALVSSWLAYGRFGWTPRTWGLIPLFVGLALSAVLDLWARIVPDAITLPGIAYALAIAAAQGSSRLGEAALGALAGGGVLLLIAVLSRGQVGGGDIKLMAMLGAATGWTTALTVFALSQIVAAVVVLGLVLVRGRWVRGSFPVGALIAILGVAALVAGP